jgi:hypothetical protein
LNGIPRLETVRGILASYARAFKGSPRPSLHDDAVYAGAQLLRIAVDFDIAESQGAGPVRALEKLRTNAEAYDPAVFATLVALRGASAGPPSMREINLSHLVVGMVLADDVKMVNGVLLAARGHEVSQRFLERLRNAPRGTITDRFLIAVRSSSEATWWAPA